MQYALTFLLFFALYEKAESHCGEGIWELKFQF